MYHLLLFTVIMVTGVFGQRWDLIGELSLYIFFALIIHRTVLIGGRLFEIKGFPKLHLFFYLCSAEIGPAILGLKILVL